MHILYIDDSGSVESPSDRHFVLGGVAVFERGLYHQIQAVDACVEAYGLGDPHDIELHASPMYAGRGFWHQVRDRKAREGMITSALATLHNRPSIRLFAIAVDKEVVSPRDAVEIAFEELCSRFDLFLTRIYNRRGDQQRGLIVMDKSIYERPLQMLARTFRIDGARWGHFRNLAEVPLFVDSAASRMVQLADLVAWSTFRKYELSDGRFFDPLIPLFDADGGVLHGLVHRRRMSDHCYCPACQSRGRVRPVG